MMRSLLILLLLLCNRIAAQPPQFEPPPTDPNDAYEQYYLQASQIINSDPTNAHSLAIEAKIQAIQTGESIFITKANFLVGRTAFAVSDLPLSYECYLRARAGYQKLDMFKDVMLCDWGLAGVHRNINQLDHAKSLYDKVLANLGNTLPIEERATLKQDIARLNIEKGAFGLAIEILTETLAQTQSSYNQSYGHYHLAFCFNEIGLIDSAKYHYLQAYENAKAANLPELVAKALNSLGYIAIESGLNEEAVGYLQEAKALSGLMINDPKLYVKINRNLALALFEMGELEKGAKVLRELLSNNSFFEGREESALAFDLFIKRYLIPQQRLTELESVYDRRITYEKWKNENPALTNETVVAQIRNVDERLLNEHLEAQLRPKNLWVTILVISGAVLLLGWIIFYLKVYRQQNKRYRASQKELFDLKERRRRMSELLRSGSGLEAFNKS